MSQDFDLIILETQIIKFRIIQRFKNSLTTSERILLSKMIINYIDKIHKTANNNENISDYKLGKMTNLMEEAEAILVNSLNQKPLRQENKKKQFEFNLWFNNLNFGSEEIFRL